MSGIIQEFRQVVESAGLMPGDIIADGSMQRCAVIGKPNKADGRYLLHLDPPASGWFKNHRTGEESTWTAKCESSMGKAERLELQARIESDRRTREAETARRHSEAAQKAQEIVSTSPDCEGHPYLGRKNVATCEGLKVSTDGDLLVPVYGPDNSIATLQMITPDGAKRYLPGGKKQGGFFPIPSPDLKGPIFVAEGLATALTVHAATNATVLVAFDAGNLEHVARYARENSGPNRQIIIAADNDTQTDGNPGRAKAENAARAVGGLVVLPEFADPTAGSDWNDLAAIDGIDAVRAQIERAGSPPVEEVGTASPLAAASIFHGLDLDKFKVGAFLGAPLPPLEWIFKDFLLTRNVALLVGPPGTGKSFLSMQLAAAIAGGRGAEGILIPGVRGKVLVLAGEEDERIIPRRVSALRDRFYPDAGNDLADLSENLIIVPLAGETLRLIEKIGAGAPVESQVFRELLELCMSVSDLRLIVVDPLSRAYGLDEQDNSAATVFITILERLAQATGACVILLHHVNKNASARRPGRDKKGYLPALEQEAARGASGFVGAVRAQINLVGLRQEEAQSLFGDGTAIDNSYLALGFPKCSYAPPRPILFLRRGDNGVLVPVDRPEVVRVRQTRELIMEWISARITDQGARHLCGFTKRSILDHYGELMSVVPLATKSELKAAVQVALDAGELVEVQGKNQMGRPTNYLALPRPVGG